MKVLVDSDCIIKITKAGIKEGICSLAELYLAPLIVKEVIDEGKKKGCGDAFEIERNLSDKKLMTIRHGEAKTHQTFLKGEMELVSIFKGGGFDAIASDDAAFLKKIERLNVPYLTPATLLLVFVRKRRLAAAKAVEYLQELKGFISDDEFLTVRLFLEKEERS